MSERSPGRRRKKTQTSSFGVGRREGHDSTPFYRRALIRPVISLDTQVNQAPEVDTVWCHSSERMRELPDNCVALMVTSPPYHVGKEYDRGGTYEEYLDLLRRVFTETYRVLMPGGRAVVNVANLGRRPYIPLAAHVIQLMEEIGYLMRGEVIWVKGKGASGSCAWGSWRSPANPTLRDIHEYCLCFSKGRFNRIAPIAPGESTVSAEEFTAGTLSVWDIPPESARWARHPAPFPVPLPRRFIELYTYKGDLVLDPFMGSGSTAIAARRTGRHYVGYDTDPRYVEEAIEAGKSGGRPGRYLTTHITEIFTALGMVHDSLDDAIACRAEATRIQRLNVDRWMELQYAYRLRDDRTLFQAAFNNGRYFAEHVMKAQAISVEWRGSRPQPPPGQSFGEELFDNPVSTDLRARWDESECLISCKYQSKILRNSSPHSLFLSLLGILPQQHVKPRNWYEFVAAKEFQDFYAACAQHVDPSLPSSEAELESEQRRNLSVALRRLPPSLQPAYEALCNKVSLASGDHWRRAIGSEVSERMFLRMMRVWVKPYYVLGLSTTGAPMRFRVMSDDDWQARYRLASFIVSSCVGRGQPRVEWQAEVTDKQHASEPHLVKGHVEVRWSHGKFCGAPEAKVYLDTLPEQVPGYESF